MLPFEFIDEGLVLIGQSVQFPSLCEDLGVESQRALGCREGDGFAMEIQCVQDPIGRLLAIEMWGDGDPWSDESKPFESHPGSKLVALGAMRFRYGADDHEPSLIP